MSVLDDATLARIDAQAREIRFWRTVATLVAGLFYAVGWSAAKAWFGVGWCTAAVKVGWQEGRKAPTSPHRR